MDNTLRSGAAPPPRTAFFIAYHYPPIRSAGVERTVKYCHYLPEFGYDVRVLTTSAFGGDSTDGVLRAWEPVGLYRRLFNRQVRRGETPSYVRTDAGLGAGPLRWLRRAALVPDGQITWLPAALLKALRTLRRDRPDLLYSTYPPASAHLLGLLLKRLTGLPWVADFRDSWIYDPLDPGLPQMPYRRALEGRLEEAVLAGADRVVAATPISASHLADTYPEAAARIEVIPNGFEPDDFRDLGPPPPRCPRGPLRIVHLGSFAHSHPQRSPEPLVIALKALLAQDSAWATRIRLVLVGQLTPAEQQAFSRLEQEGVARLPGPLERPAALACLQQADLLLLVDHPREWLASNVPGKFYEYLAMGRPILALSGPGMVKQMMSELGAGFHLEAGDTQAIREGLVDIYQRFEQGQLQVGLDPAILRQYHRRELARRLARCFDRVLEGKGQG